MNRLFILLLSIIVPSLAGVGVIAALVMGHYTVSAIIIAAAIGAVIGFPVAWYVQRQISE